MINKSVFENDLISGMQRNLISKDQENGMNKLAKAVDYLQSAAEILDNANLLIQADKVLNFLTKIAQPELKKANIVAIKSQQLDSIIDKFLLNSFAIVTQDLSAEDTLTQMGFNLKEIVALSNEKLRKKNPDLDFLLGDIDRVKELNDFGINKHDIVGIVKKDKKAIALANKKIIAKVRAERMKENQSATNYELNAKCSLLLGDHNAMTPDEVMNILRPSIENTKLLTPTRLKSKEELAEEINKFKRSDPYDPIALLEQKYNPRGVTEKVKQRPLYPGSEFEISVADPDLGPKPESMFGQFSKPTIPGKYDATIVDPTVIDNPKHRIASKHNKPRVDSPATIKKYLNRLSQYGTMLADDHDCTDNCDCDEQSAEDELLASFEDERDDLI